MNGVWERDKTGFSERNVAALVSTLSPALCSIITKSDSGGKKSWRSTEGQKMALCLVPR